jgi:hypothetical protein
MRKLKMDLVPDPDLSEGVWLMPDSLPHIKTKPASIQYVCGNCQEVIIEAFPGFRSLHPIKCVECENFNKMLIEVVCEGEQHRCFFRGN